MWKLPRFKLRTLFILQAIPAIAIGAAIWWPKSEVLPCCDEYISWYRGCGYTGQPALLGRLYFKVELPPTDSSHGIATVYLSGVDGFDPFRGYYSSGTPREEGTCFVAYEAFGTPMPDMHQMWDAICYKPNGSVGSRVQNGTGHQMYWDTKRRRVADLEFQDGHRISTELYECGGN